MRFFKNPDGTYNAINVFVTITAITFALLFLLCKGLIFDQKITSVGTPVTSTTTAKWELCRDCAISFKTPQIEMEANTKEAIKNIIEVKNTNVSSVKFSSSNKDIVNVKFSDGDVSLIAGDEVGKAVITAEIEDVRAELTVIVKASKVTSAEFAKTVYYAYVGKPLTLDITTSPKKAPLKLLNLKSDNDEIGSFDENNNFVGKQIGETKVTLTQGEETSSATINVIKNMISIKVKEDGKYVSKSEYAYPSNIDNYVELCVKIEDNYNEGFNQDSITNSIINSGKIETTVSSEGPYTLDANAYIFRAHVKIDQASDSKDNYSIITFSLPDGSKATFRITKE